ncbi:MAG: YbaN family protein [Atopobium sp.]|uniref:YbaN family protein n=1 Tax=Atopobium sp. TaxID=1872650 RepID=UPI002A7631E7|nr:YbaN family protein [Atopobium sp.]MDY2787866.1 YbaN family protein [Atopobium sp.]MDY4523108.1 YbaN family protein [Atopobium sp.]
MKIKQALFVTAGCLCLALGTIGVFLPILPTVPFYLLTVFFFAHSSERLHTWFLGTKLYEKHLASFVRGKGMTLQTKISIMILVTLLMGFGFFMMAKKGLWLPCSILAVIWLAHVYCFAFRIKTISAKSKEENHDE